MNEENKISSYNNDFYNYFKKNRLDSYYLNADTRNNQNDIIELYDESEGLIKGNMFPHLYHSYKGYKPTQPVLKNEREALMWEIQKYGFATLELQLYLDNHPDDKNILAQFTKFNKTHHNLVNEYEKRYGPLCINSQEKWDTWKWADDPWPWQGGTKNV